MQQNKEVVGLKGKRPFSKKRTEFLFWNFQQFISRIQKGIRDKEQTTVC